MQRFKQYEDAHLVYIECLNCETVIRLSSLRATVEQIEKAKAEHECGEAQLLAA
jgi:hypothetical protein